MRIWSDNLQLPIQRDLRGNAHHGQDGQHSDSILLNLALSGPLWYSLAHSCSLSGSLLLTLCFTLLTFALSDSFWLSLTESDSLGLSQALIGS